MKDVSQGNGRTVLFVSHNMAAIKSLCSRGVVLNNGMVAFDGDTQSAVDHYLERNLVFETGRIRDSIKFKKDYITVDSIKINGSEANFINIPPQEEFIDVEVAGSTDEPLKLEMKLYVRNMSGVAVAALIEGRYRANLIEVGAGSFSLRKRIRIPRFVSCGDYMIDIYLHQPLIQDYMFAPSCANIHFDGNFEGLGKPLIGNVDGFFGLETV